MWLTCNHPPFIDSNARNIRSLDDGIDAQLGHDEYRWELLRKSQQVAVPAAHDEGTETLTLP